MLFKGIVSEDRDGTLQALVDRRASQLLPSSSRCLLHCQQSNSSSVKRGAMNMWQPTLKFKGCFDEIKPCRLP